MTIAATCFSSSFTEPTLAGAAETQAATGCKTGSSFVVGAVAARLWYMCPFHIDAGVQARAIIERIAQAGTYTISTGVRSARESVLTLAVATDSLAYVRAA